MRWSSSHADLTYFIYAPWRPHEARCHIGKIRFQADADARVDADAALPLPLLLARWTLVIPFALYARCT